MRLTRTVGPAPLAIVLALSAGCSPKQIGFNRMADALTATATSFSRDDDVELVRSAAPSTLKLIEMVLDGQPRHAGLLSVACSGFTQYAYGFVQVDAEFAADTNPALAADLRGRASRMYARARGYCLRAIELRHANFAAALAKDPAAAVASLSAEDVAPLFWLGVTLGAGVSLADNPLPKLKDLVAARAILARALALNESWERGAIHEALIAFEGLPPLLGGSVDRARRHFERAVELSGGQSAFAYVTMASSVALAARDRGAFEKHLKSALAIDVNRDPTLRLANLIAQKRARYLLTKTSRLFADPAF
jgi:hypothetical protein